MRVIDWFRIFLFILVMKVFILAFILLYDGKILGGGDDARYYDAYATGLVNHATSSWPVFLRVLNEIGLYSQDNVVYVLIFLGTFFVPFLVANVSADKRCARSKNVFWYAVVTISAYPTLYYYSISMYREIFMLILWLFGLLVFKKISVSKKLIQSFFLFSIGLAFSYILYDLRKYMGFSFLFALIFSRFYSFRYYSLLSSLVIFLALIFLAYKFDFLKPILDYRRGFSGLNAGSNLNIGFFSEEYFLIDLLKSLYYQVFGAYFISKAAAILFFIETLPFVFFLYYLVKNRKFSNKFVDYLILFFISYTTIWVLGNDNLGTAVRLRMFSYISIMIAAFVVMQNKACSKKYREPLNKSPESAIIRSSPTVLDSPLP